MLAKSILRPTAYLAAKNIAIAAVIAISAKLCLDFAYINEVGYVWAPAGIALGFALLFGSRIWPGIFFGMMIAVADYMKIFPITPRSPIDLFLAFTLGLGASFQAIGVAMLLRRIKNWRLGGTTKLLLKVAIGGPIGSLLFPTLATLSFILAGTLPTDNLVERSLSWWIANNVGVLLFTPIVIIAAKSLSIPPVKTDGPGFGYLVVLFILMFPIGSTLAAWRATSESIATRNQNWFASLAEENLEALQSRINSYEQSLLGGTGLFRASNNISNDEWQEYAEVVGIKDRFPGMGGIGYISNFREIDLADLNKIISQHRPAQSPPPEYDKFSYYFPIKLLEPLTPGNKTELGRNIGLEHIRLTAALRAAETGATALTRPIQRRQDRTQGPVFMLLHAIYKNGLETNTAAQRLRAVRGWTFAPFVGSAFLHDLTLSQGVDLHLTVYEGTKQSEKNMIFDGRDLTNADSDRAPKYIISQTYDIMQRPWTLVWSSTQEFDFAVQDSQPQIVLISGMTLSGVLALLFYMMAKRAATVQTEVTKQTKKIADTQTNLQAVLDTVVDGIVQFSDSGKIMAFNPSAEQIFGYQAADVVGKSIELLLPDVSDGQNSALQDYLESGTSQFAHTDGTIAGRRSDSTIFPMELSINEMSFGEEKSFVASIRDITERFSQQLVLEENHDRIALATDSGRIGIWDFDFKSDILLWDSWMYRLFGLPEQSPGTAAPGWNQNIHPDDLDAFLQAMNDAADDVRPLNAEYRIIWPDGSIRHVRSSGRVRRDEEQNPSRMIGVTWDVSDLRQVTLDLEEQHQLLRVTLQSIGDAVITTDAYGNVQWLNPVAQRLTGWTASEALDQPIAQVFNTIYEETRQTIQDPATIALATRSPVDLEHDAVLISRNGIEYGIEHSASPIRDSSGEVHGVVLVFRDVSERRKLAQDLQLRASRDPLTGLVNRSEFDIQLNEAFTKGLRNDISSVLICLDLDQFKIVNDACGHAVGDELLQQVGKLLKKETRAGDVIARLGGDEFSAILEDCSLADAQATAQRVCDQMDEYRFAHEDRRFRVGCSIGIAPISDEFINSSAVLQAADAACYAAKEAGRNRVHVWNETDAALQARSGEMRWATRLEQAIDEDQFILYVQRIQSISNDNQKEHAEILLRLAGDDGEIIAPSAFLPAAERFGLAPRIDHWVLNNALTWLKSEPNLARIGLIGINLSGRSMGDRSFHQFATDIFSTSGPEVCSRVCIEITETAAISNLADATRFINQVRELGVKVALDDFGAGSSSFGYLKALPVDFLKIDGQFIRNLINDPLSAVTVRCFNELSNVVGVKTIAEYVEDEAIYNRLGEMGIDYAQGYFIHKPEPLTDYFASQALRA